MALQQSNCVSPLDWLPRNQGLCILPRFQVCYCCRNCHARDKLQRLREFMFVAQVIQQSSCSKDWALSKGESSFILSVEAQGFGRQVKDYRNRNSQACWLQSKGETTSRAWMPLEYISRLPRPSQIVMWFHHVSCCLIAPAPLVLACLKYG